jgi:hypothetical protein
MNILDSFIKIATYLSLLIGIVAIYINAIAKWFFSVHIENPYGPYSILTMACVMRLFFWSDK